MGYGLASRIDLSGAKARPRFPAGVAVGAVLILWTLLGLTLREKPAAAAVPGAISHGCSATCRTC